MSQCKVSLETIRRWSRGKTSKGLTARGHEAEVIEDFCAAFDGLREVCSRGAVEAINEIVDDKEHPKRLDASKWVAGKTWPDRWGEKSTTQVGVTVEHAPSVEGVADIDQVVWDEMTNEEFELHESLDQEIAALQSKQDKIIEAIKKRVE